MIYLDNSATTRQYDAVTDAMAEAMRVDFGNPSSLHRLGMEAEKLLKEARKQVAVSLGADADCVYFTGSGTESDNIALLGNAKASKRGAKKIITTAVEHPAILETCKHLEERGFEIVRLGVDGNCLPNLAELENALSEDTALVSVMTVNNEIGTIMPLEAVAEAVRKFNKAHGTEILLHSDMVQAWGKVRVNIGLLDMASVSAHKIHGPKGMGGLYVRKGLHPQPIMYGGGQEKDLRPSTENMPGIVGMGLAAQLACGRLDERVEKMRAARTKLLEGIRANIADVKINSPESGEICCPAVLNVSFLGVRAEVLLHSLEQSEIYVSTGSACSSNHKGKKGSHVLRAMGLNDKEVESAVRFSFCEFNTPEDMDTVTEVLTEAVSKLRRLGAFR